MQSQVPTFTDDIDRHDWSALGRMRYVRDYASFLKPVIIRGAFDHWPARTKWNLTFLRDRYGDLPITIDGEPRMLGPFIDEVLSSTPERPAPYLHNHLMALWPTELQSDIAPMPECTRPNWLESRFFPSRQRLTFIEVYIGGAGARFPTLHYDGLHTHAFLMQIQGVKEYVALPPEAEPLLYTPYAGSNTSPVDVQHPDLECHPLFAQATGFRFNLNPGETLFVPAGWWHTARILSSSITISINGVNAANWGYFFQDFRRTHCSSSLKGHLKAAYVQAFGFLHLVLAGAGIL